MMHKLVYSSLIALTALLISAPLHARQSDSVVEAARRAREQKKLAPKPVHVYTNDNMPAAGVISVVGPAAEVSGTGTPTAQTTSPNREHGRSASQSKDEANWRSRFAAVRTKLRQAQTDLGLLQREMGDLRVQYYPNPQEALAQGYTRSDIVNKQAAIDAKQKDIAALQQQESSLEDELRRAGGEPGWAREP